MRKFASVVLLVACVLVSVDASGQKKRRKEPCDEAMNQHDLNMCADREFKAADAVLNRVYQQLLSKSGADKAKLKEAEIAWLKYRDANCDYEASAFEGGSMQPMIYSFCLARMTRNRTAEFQLQLKDMDK